ncbi:MAG: 5-formyltetrahydrofolate cyclo-ligase [Actinomycetota bacterium]
MDSGQLKREKRLVRLAVLERRDALSTRERERLGALVTARVLALPEVATARAVMAFWAFGSEVPTIGLIEALVSREVKVALPRIVDGELEPRTWRPGEPTTTTSFGALEPAGGEALAPSGVDVVVTPAVAFDRTGRRVGYGGGYYDRFFPRARPDAFRLGMAFGLQLLDRALPAGHFDLPVHAVATESETVRCPPTR